MSLSNNYPTIRPTLEFDFANVGALDPRITFTRATTATFVNQLGVIQTAASGIPRFDYDPSTLAARGLLIEEQRTNLLLYSEDLSNVTWVKYAASITTNAATAPDGTATADKIIAAATTDFHFADQSVVTPTGCTISVYMKAAEYTSGSIFLTQTGNNGAVFNLATGAVTSVSGTGNTATITNAGNGWYRCTVTNSGDTADVIRIAPQNGALGSFTGDGTSGILIWGAQLEAGSFATSYIPTVASTVTRNADVATVNTLTPWYNATEGAFLFDFNQVGTSAIAAIGDDTFNNSLRFNIAQMARGVGSGFANVVLLGTSQNGSRKLAVAMKVNDYAGSFDGGAVSTQTTASMTPSPTVLGVGRDYGTNGYMNGWMRRLAYYPARLTNAQLQALTS